MKLEQILTAWAELHPEHPLAVGIQTYATTDWQNSTTGPHYPTPSKQHTKPTYRK